MRYSFNIADQKVELLSPVTLCVKERLKQFSAEELFAPEEEKTVIRIVDFSELPAPQTEPAGTDLLLQYYKEGSYWSCEAPGQFGPVIRVRYTEDFKDVTYAINEKAYPDQIVSAGKILQLFPMRQWLFYHHIFLLHSSQILTRGKGILFTGDSGIGKTTQAGFWQKQKGAELICNDRTAIRKTEGKWKTYSYIIDGSRPSDLMGAHEPGAVVVLGRGPEDKIRKMDVAEAVSALIRQLMIDTWNPDMCGEMLIRLMEFVEEIPVYELLCAPGGEKAPDILEQYLREEGIL